jgi:hypothetical protein
MHPRYKPLSFASQCLTVRLQRLPFIKCCEMNQTALVTASQMTCSHCSAAIGQQDRFCRDCGTRQVQRGKQFSAVLLDQRRKEETTNPLMKAEMLLLAALATFVISTVVWCIRGPAGPAKQPVAAKKADTKPLTELDRLFAQAKTMPKAIVRQPNAPRIVIRTPEPVAVAAGRGEMRVAERTESRSAPPVQLTRNKNVEDVAEYNKALVEFFQKTKTPEVLDTVDGVPTAPLPAEPPSFEEWVKSGKKAF